MRLAHIVSVLTTLLFAVAAHAREPDIILTEVSAARWRVEYRLDAPTESLHFLRSSQNFRTAHWKPEDAAWAMRTSGDRQVLRRRDGRPFRSVRFDVDVGALGITANYEPFLRYSDGGVIAYTGYYFACADAPCAASAAFRITVEPQRRRRATRGTSQAASPLHFVDSGDGSNVYVGASDVAERARYKAIIDSALPSAFGSELNTALPRIMDYYAKRLGPLPRKPLFLISMSPGRSENGYETRGSALPDQVSIHLAGRNWGDRRRGVEPGFLPWYLAHEAAHLHQRIEDRPNAVDFMGEGWIHEGGAEALAALAVAAVRPDLRHYVDARIAEAAEDCDEGLRSLGAPLNASIDRGAADNYYVCGLVMQIAIDRDVRAASAGARDLFDVWSTFLHATRRGDSWSEATFLRAARIQGAGDDTLALVSTLARKRAAWAQEAVRERLLAAPAERRR